MIELKVEPRIVTGKKVKHMRQNGVLPAVLYGDGVAAQSIAVAFKDFEKIYKEAGESTLLKITIGSAHHTVLIHDIAHDALRGSAIHADFYAVRMDKMLRISVPIVFIGESPAVKNEGGILVKVVQEIEVEALPVDLPHELRADLSLLASLHTRIFVRDLPHASSVKIITDADEIVALVEPPRSEEAMAELSGAPTAEIKEVKTEREMKAEEKSKESVAEEK